MIEGLNTKTAWHGLYRLEYHIVLVTKYRKRCITQEMFSYLRGETERLMSGWDIELLEMNFEPDHVHLLISTTPKACLETVINSCKSTTSRLVRKKFQAHLSNYYWKPCFWSRSYLILSSGGAPIEVIKRYIQNQKGEQ